MFSLCSNCATTGRCPALTTKMRKRHEYSSTRTADYESPLGKPLGEDSHVGGRNARDSIHSVPFYVALVVLLLLLGIYGAVYLVEQKLPTPLSLDDEVFDPALFQMYTKFQLTNPDAFITDRARHDLKRLTAFGSRVMGSYENELYTVDFLTREIDFIKQKAHKNHVIEVDVQVTRPGSYYLDIKPGGRINSYGNLQNVVVKLHADNHTDSSLLVNSHFDSVPTSPGGSDDGISVVTMLEILRKMSQSPKRPLHNVVFLFNGAEETGLQASHGFITQHKWAAESKVVINLEAAGAGGRIILFQSGPATAWLMKYYSMVPHPYGQAAGEEIFQSDLIPSDTDFRIFRDFGGLVGMDMAFYKSGYRYHTKYDDYEHIPPGSYQHLGDNALSLVRNIANAPELGQTNNKKGKMVFFDVLGWFMVSYTQSTGNAINYIVVIISLAMFILSFHSFKLGYTKQTLTYVLLTFSATIGGWALSVIFISLLAFFIDLAGFSMRWYGHPWLVLGLYSLPTVLLSGSLLPLIQHKNLVVNVKSHIQAHCARLIWTLLLLVGTALNIRTMYAIMIPVAFNSFAFVLIYLSKLQHSVRSWQIVYLIAVTIPVIFLMYSALITLSLFIPLTGRIGPDKNADLLIGVMTFFFTILIVSPYVALVNLVRNLKYFHAILWSLFILNLIIACTPVGFPYSGDSDAPTPQRYWILHTRRVFYNQNGSEFKRDAGYFLLNMDRNSPNMVRPYVKDLARARSLDKDCQDYLMCGLPLAHSKMVQIMQYSTWIPAGQPLIPQSVELQVVSKISLSRTVVRYNVSITGPDRIGVYLSPKSGDRLLNMSLMEGVPSDYVSKSDGRSMYYVKHIWAKSPAPLVFTFDIETPPKNGDPAESVLTEIAISGIFVHEKENRKVPHYAQFLSQFPDWADLTAWLGSYESRWI